MKQRQLKLVIATTPFGSNGGAASEHPDVRDWLIATTEKLRADKRIESWAIESYNLTPTTYARNKAVMEAYQAGADLLLFVDSDMAPDNLLGKDPEVKPFWDVAFNFVYDNWDKGPLVVGAPYMGGGSEHEPCLISRWRSFESSFQSELNHKLSPYTREEAFSMSGIHECATLPTGLILYTMSAFDLIEPNPDDTAELLARPLVRRIEGGNKSFTPLEIKEIVAHIVHETRRLSKPWFYYEYGDDPRECTKTSSEDIANTRDISMAGLIRLGYNPLHCAWSSWAGHWKSRLVSKPHLITASDVAERLHDAVKRGNNGKLVNLGS